MKRKLHVPYYMTPLQFRHEVSDALRFHQNLTWEAPVDTAASLQIPTDRFMMLLSKEANVTGYELHKMLLYLQNSTRRLTHSAPRRN